jgi:hypothetical protein
MAARKKNKVRKLRKKTARAGVASKNKPAKKKTAPHRRPSRKKIVTRKKRFRGSGEVVETVAFEPRGLGARSGGQSGDLQGLSRIAGAASESVEELLEEGNAFEADVVKGVEEAEDSDEHEVVTHEVLEDDVPKEYLEEK